MQLDVNRGDTVARRITLSSSGMSKLIGLGLLFAYVGLHKLGEAVGLLESPPSRHQVALSAPPPESLAQRDAEVKLMIAERSARAKVLNAQNSQ